MPAAAATFASWIRPTRRRAKQVTSSSVCGWLAATLALSVVTSGCSRSNAQAAATPAVLRIAFVPQHDQEERSRTAYAALQGYLKESLKIPVQIQELDSANVALEAMRSRKIDVCNFSPWPFLLAEKKAGAEAFLTTGAPDGLPVHYYTVLIAHPDSDLKSLEDVKARSRELVFSFEEAVSTSGHLVPRQAFYKIGLQPERDFKQMLFSPDSTVLVLAIKARRLDLAAVSDSGLKRNLAKGRVTEQDVRVVWKSEPVLSNVMAIRRELPAEFKQRLRDALIALPRVAPETWQLIVRQYSNPVASYLVATESLLAPYREMVRHVPALQSSL
jgi:phosphonate transport system substrate-binding protein